MRGATAVEAKVGERAAAAGGRVAVAVAEAAAAAVEMAQEGEAIVGVGAEAMAPEACAELAVLMGDTAAKVGKEEVERAQEVRVKAEEEEGDMAQERVKEVLQVLMAVEMAILELATVETAAGVVMRMEVAAAMLTAAAAMVVVAAVMEAAARAAMLAGCAGHSRCSRCRKDTTKTRRRGRRRCRMG